MIRIRKALLISAVSLIATHESASAAEKIRMDKDIVVTLEQNYKIYNARKSAQREVQDQVREMEDTATESFQYKKIVILPICDQPAPFEWKFMAPSENERVLKYMGDREFGSQFLRWTDSAWVRIAGPNEFNREGMYCGRPYAREANADNFILLNIDESFAKNVRTKNTPTELIDGVLLQLASKEDAAQSRLMKGEVQISAGSIESELRVSLEIWSLTADGPKHVSTKSEKLSQAGSSRQKIEIEARVDANTQPLLIMRLDARLQDQAANGEVAGKVLLFDARLQPIDG